MCVEILSPNMESTLINLAGFIVFVCAWKFGMTNTAEEDGSADGIECAVDNGFGGGRDFVSDWFGYFRFYCFHSLFCCFHLQRQACLLIRLSTIQWCFCFLTKRCGYNVDDVFFSEAAALRLL
ncbi:hypothetical protein OIU78_006889 [Salix suchowensis]|nr:hypothetical protein OIU78_006889 [Salix suchowensis]